MPWFDHAVFYHIYPLGLTGAPKQNTYGEPEHRLNTLIPWIGHIRKLGCNALYIGPLFESVGHGYETTDYFKLDSRLGTNDDLKNFVAECHQQGIRVVLDGVFNHVGRDFFAFQDLKMNRENSPYRDWFSNVNFFGNNEYNDGFSYDNWGGYNLLVKLNHHHWAVREHLCSAVSMWIREFAIDGLRLDAADVLDFDFMRALREMTENLKPEFWLMGEVIHGDYTRWANAQTLHSVTDYALHKGLYSGMNDHNFFEIAHTVNRLYNMGLNHQGGLRLYSFVDNHDVERIYTKLSNKSHFTPVHILLYTLPGIPSVYYGSEFGIEGRKERGSDDSLRPTLQLEEYLDAYDHNPCTRLIALLGAARQAVPALTEGEYQELVLRNRQFAFARTLAEHTVIIAVNNDDQPAQMQIPAQNTVSYTGIISRVKITAWDGVLMCTIPACSGEIWVPAGGGEISQAEMPSFAIQEVRIPKREEKPTVSEKMEEVPSASHRQTVVSEQEETVTKEASSVSRNVSYEEMTVEELQQTIIARMAQNGPVTDRMRRDVEENIWHDSLLNWIRSFR